MATVQEIINLITPFVPSSKVTNLADSSSILWNFNNGNIANLTISGTRVLSMSNVPSNSFGILNLTQGSGGQHLLSLPGKTGNSLNFSSAPGDIDLLGFFYDGNSFYWSVTNYGNVVIPTVTLSTPGNFSLSVISSNEIDASWNTVQSASTYILQRTLDSSYVTGLTTVMASSSTSFPDTTLTGSTTYYYRVQATAFGYFPSLWATANATTQASLTPTYLSWNNITTTQFQQFNSNQGIQRQATPNTSSASVVYSTTTLTNGQLFDYTVDTPGSNVYNLWLTSASTNINIALGIGQNSAATPFAGLNTALLVGNALFTPSNGNRIRYQYSDNQLYILYSTDGVNWNTYYISHITPATSYVAGLGSATVGFGTSVIFQLAAGLSPVQNFIAIGQQSGSTVNINWSSVVNATSYTLQRATASGFGGAVTTLYTGSGLNYTDSGTVNNQGYFYRIKAVGTGSNSPWSLYNISTSNAGDPMYLPFNYSGSQMEPTPSYKGIRMISGSNTSYPVFCYSYQTFTASQAVVFDIDNTSSDSFSVAFSPNTSSNPIGNILEVNLNGSISVKEGGTTKATAPASVGMQFRLSYHTSSVFWVDSSSNSGSTWTTFFTSSVSRTGSYFFGFRGASQNFGPNNVYTMSISN